MISVLPAADSVAERLVRDERLKMLTFTGSAKVGWHLKTICGKKRVCLELGGNAAVVVDSDADILYAAARCARGAVSNNGQSCISVQRVYVHDSIYDHFASAMLAEMASFKAGDPTDHRTDVGPLIRESEARRVEAWVAAAVASGAKILCGGKRFGSFFAPTLIASEDQTLTVSCEEVFAPVAVLSRYANFDEALSLVNNSRYGLQAGVFTKDGSKAMQAFEALQVGAVLINEVPTWRDDTMPYGGTKDSGIGREGPLYAYLEMTEPRLLIKASAD
jgi:glyceraldehyde-3-phosphate dehydrogenase (NADP+)